MKKLLSLVCCSLFLFTGCKDTSYFQSTELIENESTIQQTEDIPEESSDIYVQVSGAVSTPGVYSLPSGSRVYEAIELAGGMLDTADDSDVNQASLLEDGQKIYIYTVDEAKALKEQEALSNDGLININTAGAAELMTLPGIGQTKADQIVGYRNTNGDFSSIEDIKNVSGIGDGIYKQICSLIKI